MGGQYEDMVSPAAKAEKEKKPESGNLLMPELSGMPDSGIPQVGSLSQAIRYHVSGGDVHFHVDAGKGPNKEDMKVAVPVAEWWTAWEKLKNLRGSNYSYIDHEQGCMLTVTAGLNEKGEFEIIPSLKKISNGTGPVFNRLEEFMDQQRKKKSK